MNLAIINKETNIVENTIVPPKGAQAWFLGDGYYAVETDIGATGDTYTDGVFIKPPPKEGE